MTPRARDLLSAMWFTGMDDAGHPVVEAEDGAQATQMEMTIT